MVLEYPTPDQPLSTSRDIHHQISTSTEQNIPPVGFMVPYISHESLNGLEDSRNECEAMRKEIEKERIREEIIAKEAARRHMLEIEVRREMMEREIAMRGGGGGGGRFASLSYSPFLKQQPHEAMEQISEVVPFQHRAVGANISTLNPILKNQSAEAEILQIQPYDLTRHKGIVLVKPNTVLTTGATDEEDVADDKPSLSGSLVNNVNKEWFCAVCEVSTTNQCGLNEHFQGKKHKRMEATLREPKEDKNYKIGFLPKKPKLIQQLVESPCDDMKSRKESDEGSSDPNDNNLPSLIYDDNLNDLTKNIDDTTTHKKEKKSNNREFKFWCETCKIGTFAEKVMETHKLGKKHAKRLQQLIGEDS